MAQKNTKSISLKAETLEQAKKSADEYGISMLEFFEKATERYYKRAFFNKLQNDFIKLSKVNDSWKKEIRRRENIGINLPNSDTK
ncbi:MAG: hypothetical protein WD267_12570 [Balneolales bacterium]